MLASGWIAAVAEGGGLDPLQFVGGAAFWTWVIFLGALPLMWKFVFGPITKALAERDQRVVEAARAAEEARRQAEEAVANARAEREQARAEARRLVQEATERAERQAQEAIRQARTEAERQLEAAREDIENEKRRALLEIRQEVVELTIASAERILRRDLDDEAHRRMVQEFLGDLAEQRN